MKTILKYISVLFLVILFNSCGIYSFTGADTGNAETFQVNYFQNTAVLVEPGIDRDFTNALRDLITNQTNLNLVRANADLVYEGEITEYRISPTTATSNNKAAQNRLTIGVQVRFTNRKKEDADFDKKFTFFYDYNGTAQLSGSQKTTAINTIFERITQDVFNAAFSDW